ncbi:MAG: sigma 54-interacting transcriptional regulator [Pseudomonadota bacterium]
MRHALELIVGGSADTRAYLELFDPNHLGDGGHYSVGFPEAELATVKTLVSHGIIAEAIASERVIATPSAILDPRFRDRASVKQSRIDAVICAPIGKNPPRGVLYVQNPRPSKEVLEEQAARIELIARHLAPIAEQVISRRRLQGSREVAELREKLGAEEFVGTSASLLRLLQEVQAVANFDISLLLSGDTGTGKSQLARLIHRNSRRANGPFVELNCATLPEHLVESELFGAMPGAHSTASRRIEGKVSSAAQGTLLLDEIAELSLPSQAKLLQLLQSKEYFPLGASRPQHADVRIIAASNVDLSEAVAEKRFRQDLYYRLQVLSIRLPTLAERRQDARRSRNSFVDACRRCTGCPMFACLQRPCGPWRTPSGQGTCASLRTESKPLPSAPRVRACARSRSYTSSPSPVTTQARHTLSRFKKKRGAFRHHCCSRRWKRAIGT